MPHEAGKMAVMLVSIAFKKSSTYSMGNTRQEGIMRKSEISLWVAETLTFVFGVGGLMALMVLVSVAMGA